MRKILFTLLCAFSALFFLPVSTHATDYTIFPDANVASYALPISYFHQPSYYGSISQQIYWAEELTDQGASAGDINSITFYYTAAKGTTADAFSRSIEIWLMEVANTTDVYSIETVPWPSGSGNDYLSAFLHNGTTKKAGVKVFDGSLATESVTSSNPINFATDIKSVTLPISSFSWDGSKNIVMTVIDKTNTKQSSANLRFLIASTKVSSTSYPRFTYTRWIVENDERLGWISDFSGAKYGDHYPFSPSSAQKSDQAGQRSYVNKVTFSITPSAGPSVPATPSDLHVEATLWNAAVLAWSSVEGATSYDLQQSADGTSWSTLEEGTDETSFLWEDLAEASTQYARIRANNANGSSDWSSPVTVTTDAKHTHDGITFDKWNNPSVLPKEGNYYLNDDVAFDWDSDDVTLTGNLNLCLNGHEADLAFFKIIVPDGKTLTIYDHVGGGKITSFVASQVGIVENLVTSLIVVRSGGTLILKQGTIENTYTPDADGESYAIYSNGTVRFSGDVRINSNSADFYLYASHVITLDGAISNEEKHTVWKNGGAFTSGWSTYMSGENPRDFFESANPARSVCLNEGEAALRTALNLSESSANAAIGDNYNQTVDVNLTRSLTSSQFNTFCLPFALSAAQMEEFFGAGYDLEEFVSSGIIGDELVLSFNKVTSLEAGKPYLLQPSVNVVNPAFEGVTITAIAPADQTSDEFISFHGTFAPTELAGSNKNLLFLGAGNELFWPAATGNLKGFRAYFEVKGAAQKAKAARIVKKEDQTQAIDNIENSNPAQKRILNGQLVIEKNGTFYNAQGQIVK